MSDETYEAVQEALRAHVAESQPEWPLLTDWYVVCASVGQDMNSTGYLHVTSDGPPHHAHGLLVRGIRRMESDEFDD